MAYRVYHAGSQTVRESRNVIFIETPFVVPAPDFETAFDEGTFAYDEPDDLVRDVRNVLPRKDLGSSSFSSRTKHIALRFFYVRELVNDGVISIHHIPTENQLGDIGTKSLNKQRLRFLINSIKNFGN